MTALSARGTALGAEPPGPAGPKPSSARVACRPDSVSHAGVTVTVIGDDRMEAALLTALHGDPQKAVAQVASVRETTWRRADRYYVGRGGAVLGESGPPGRLSKQCDTGLVRQLTPAEVTAHLDGRTIGYDTSRD